MYPSTEVKNQMRCKSKHWLFTKHIKEVRGYSDLNIMVEEMFSGFWKSVSGEKNFDRAVVQLEETKNQGLHFQGYIQLFKPLIGFKVKSYLGKGVHIETVDHPDKAIAYCQKARTRVEGPFYYTGSEFNRPFTIMEKMRELQDLNLSMGRLEDMESEWY